MTKALAKRIEKYLPKLINSDQTGFVKGRYIGQNIRLLNDIMEYLGAKKTSGLLLFIDFEKAFDSLEVIFQKRVRVFHRGFKHEKTDESTRLQAECFYCFRVFETPMKHEARVFEMYFSNKRKLV